LSVSFTKEAESRYVFSRVPEKTKLKKNRLLLGHRVALRRVEQGAGGLQWVRERQQHIDVIGLFLVMINHVSVLTETSL
jgi:hypothetical protein